MNKKEAPKHYDKMFEKEVEAPSAEPENKPTKPERLKMRVSKLVNFRAKPNGTILLTLKAGTIVTVDKDPILDIVEWHFATFVDGDIACDGYIMADFLEKV